MAESWPETVPSRPKVGAQQASPFRTPLATEMEDGNVRRRRATTLNTATLQFSIQMSAAEFNTFKVWVRDDLVDGTLPFTAPVWTGAAYATKTCCFAQPYSDAQIGGRDHSVSVMLEVEDW